MIFIWLLFFTSSLIIAKADRNVENIRLPSSIQPEHYHVGIAPDLSGIDGKIEGFVHVDLFVKSATSKIVLHAVNLFLIDESIAIHPLENIEDLKIKAPILYDKEKQFVIINLENELQKSHRYRLSFNYTGNLSKNLKGFYRSDYLEMKTASKKWLGVTQFEPTAARSAFPCFDEPAMKATFTVSLGRHANFTSLSNMPLVKSEPMDNKEDWYWDFYEKSVPMSTYLVACLISEFGFRQGRSVVRSSEAAGANVTEVRIWARPEALDQTKKAVEVTPVMLEFLEKYFQVQFPLPKVDLVALPDFSSGAMENWGLITYRETTLLVDPKSAAVKDEMNVERVIAHELAHQWFGNLVTMKWWNDLWLNEGFATYVQRLVLDNVSPKYQYGALQTLDFLNVMEADGLNTSHPISVEVAHPTQITEIFDAISYTKGSAVIRMMNLFLGEETFRKGVTNYLNQKRYGNAEQDELWQFLTEQAHTDGALSLDVNVKSIMDTWTLQMGYPLITITRNYSSNTAFIDQKRYLRGNNRSKKSNKWWIPISLTDGVKREFSEKSARPIAWLTPNETSIELSIQSNKTWLIANVLASGYYRVNYDPDNWELINKQLKEDHHAVHAINRATLIDDSFSLAGSGFLPYSTAFSLIEYLSKEDHYVPWASALRSFNYIGRMFSFTKNHGRYKAFMRSLVIPALKSFGSDLLEDDAPIMKLLRISLTSQACALEYKPCIKKAKDQFETWMESANVNHFKSIAPDLRPSVLCTAIKFGGELEWDFAFKAIQNMTNAQDRDVLLSALGCSREPWILMRYLSYIFDSKTGIRKQDGRRVISSVASNVVGRRIAFNFVMKHFDELFSYFGNPIRVLQMLSSTTSGLNTDDELMKVRRFMESKREMLKSAQTSANNIESVVAANVQWMSTNYEKLNRWFILKGF